MTEHVKAGLTKAPHNLSTHTQHPLLTCHAIAPRLVHGLAHGVHIKLRAQHALRQRGQPLPRRLPRRCRRPRRRRRRGLPQPPSPPLRRRGATRQRRQVRRQPLHDAGEAYSRRAAAAGAPRLRHLQLHLLACMPQETRKTPTLSLYPQVRHLQLHCLACMPQKTRKTHGTHFSCVNAASCRAE